MVERTVAAARPGETDADSVTPMSVWLRPLTTERHDVEAMHRIFGDPACMSYWHRPVSESIDDTATVVAELVRRGDGTWAIGADLAADEDPLGFVSFVQPPRPDAIVGFGYAVRHDAWGRGITTEACREALARGFDDVGIAGVELWIHEANRASRRVAEKLGATVRSRTLLGYESGRAPAVIYGLTRGTWRGGDPDPPVAYAVEPVLAVTDLDRSARWWCDVLGFVESMRIGDPPALVRVSPGPWAGTPAVQLRPATPADAVGTAMLLVAAGMDIEGRSRAAVDAGATVLTPLGRRPWGLVEIELADPDGNRVRLTSPG